MSQDANTKQTPTTLKNPKKKITFICPDCKQEPPVNKDKSTKNWQAINAKCPDCNKRVIMQVTSGGSPEKKASAKVVSKAKPMKKPRGLNVRQQRYKKNRIAGMSAYSAARKAGYSHSYATHANERIDAKLSTLSEYLDQEGLTDKKLASNIREMTEADKEGEKGSKLPDWLIREKGNKLALLAKKHLTNDIKIDNSQRTTKIVMYGKPQAEKEEKGFNVRNTSTRKRVPAAR